jgi:hypothetical protein
MKAPFGVCVPILAYLSRRPMRHPTTADGLICGRTAHPGSTDSSTPSRIARPL